MSDTNYNQIQTLINTIFTQFSSSEERIEELKKRGYRVDRNDYHYNIFKYVSDEQGSNCTGVIFNPQGKLVGHTSKKTIDNILHQNYGIEQFNGFVDTNALRNESMYVYKYINGSRVFTWFDNETQTWKLSTSKAVDAFNANWGTDKTFGTMFEEILVTKNLISQKTTFNDWAKIHLNTDYCYTFIIVHPDMKQISGNIEHQLYLVNVSNTNDFSTIPLHQYRDTNITSSVIEQCNANGETFIGNDMIKLQYYYNQICIGSITGIIIVDSQNRQFKLLNNKFQEVLYSTSTIKSDENNYLNIRTDEFKKNMFLSLFPNKLQWTLDMENKINGYLQKLFFEYVNYFMKKHKTQLEKPIHVFICQLHKEYLEKCQKITINKTITHFNSLGLTDQIRLYNTCKVKYDNVDNSNNV